jgi:hypothetical protein
MAGRFPALVSVILLAGLGSDYLSAAEIHDLSYLFSKQVGITTHFCPRSWPPVLANAPADLSFRPDLHIAA